MSNEPQTYLIRLKAVGPGPPVVQRLRGALKCLLRTFGLKCVTIAEEIPETPPAEPENDDDW